MARIPITGGFQRIPEGEHDLKITKVEYEEDFGKLSITLVNVKGLSCLQRFNLLNQDSTANEKAMNSFSYLAKNAMNDFDMEDVDPVELVGHYIHAEVTHREVPNRNDPNKTTVFVNLGNMSPADGFDGVPAPTPAPKASGLDLAALLGK